MKFEIFKFGNVTSTNDVAINLIKEEQKEEGLVEENGFLPKEICLDQFFFH